MTRAVLICLLFLISGCDNRDWTECVASGKTTPSYVIFVPVFVGEVMIMNQFFIPSTAEYIGKDGTFWKNT